MRCTNTEVVEGRTLCLNCGHIESAHPQPRTPAGSFIRQFRDAGRLASISSKSSSSVPRATQGEAEAETSTGLKKKRKSETDTEPGVSKRKKKAEPVDEKAQGGEDVGVGHIVVLVNGTKGKPSQHTLARTKPPTLVELDVMKKHKLATDLKASSEIQAQLWLAVIKSKQSLALSTEDLPTGASLAAHAKRKGHKGSERILYIASKIEVPEEQTYPTGLPKRLAPLSGV
ncbi:hypothetical protein B0H14DRAFT_3901296 [Mycena olivaceomarginata]|nr:hypothetical protein B0H14DRAFT_3901296 [Mycena olivaceomarginata]